LYNCSVPSGCFACTVRVDGQNKSRGKNEFVPRRCSHINYLSFLIGGCVMHVTFLIFRALRSRRDTRIFLLKLCTILYWEIQLHEAENVSKTESHSARQEISRLLWKPQVHCRVHKRPLQYFGSVRPTFIYRSYIRIIRSFILCAQKPQL
jgi:hypothetical protein